MDFKSIRIFTFHNVIYVPCSDVENIPNITHMKYKIGKDIVQNYITDSSGNTTEMRMFTTDGLYKIACANPTVGTKLLEYIQKKNSNIDYKTIYIYLETPPVEICDLVDQYDLSDMVSPCDVAVFGISSVIPKFYVWKIQIPKHITHDMLHEFIMSKNVGVEIDGNFCRNRYHCTLVELQRIISECVRHHLSPIVQ